MYYRPKEYEFSYSTKIQALKRSDFSCQDCGVRQADGYYLAVHHILGIAYARYYYPDIPASVVSHLANARVLCETDHIQADNDLRHNHQEKLTELLASLNLLYKDPFAQPA